MSIVELDAVNEKIEGLDAGENDLGGYPIDTVLIRTEPRTVYEVLRRMEAGFYIMNPEFQRDFIWPEDKQSKLIESVLMRIPLPVFYLAEDDAGHMIVVDGLQRLSTFKRFFDNELRLKLPGRRELDGKRFNDKDFAANLKNRFEDCNLMLYIIDHKVPERVRLDIFERVNSGVPLSRQQMRNCLYMGQATRFLKEEATTDVFLEATGRSLKTSTMRDREFVNRFCAFQLLQIALYKEMDDFLAEALKKMNRLTTAQIQELSQELRSALRNNFRVFGKHAFRKHTARQKDRSVVNASLWDVMSTGLSRIPESVVKQRAKDLRAAFYARMMDEAFVKSITYSPNSTNMVQYRFQAAKAMFREVFGADASRP
jgi:hypothetical protein